MIASTLVLALACFTTINTAASIASWVVGASLQRQGRRPPAGALLAIRLFPALLSLLFSAVVFVPSHWATEPRDTTESFGAVLYILACAGGLLISRRVVRAFALARADRALRSRERLSPIGAGLREAEGLPGLALAGVLRTRILAGPAVAAHLSPAELDIAIAHEIAHRRAFDNLKRWALYCAPDLFGWSSVAQRLEREWHAAAEALADARAVSQDPQRALDLAAALIKVARLTVDVPAFRSTPAWSTLNDPALLEYRVHRLACNAPVAPPPRAIRSAGALFLLVCATIMLLPVVSDAIHQITETMVALLP